MYGVVYRCFLWSLYSLVLPYRVWELECHSTVLRLHGLSRPRWPSLLGLSVLRDSDSKQKRAHLGLVLRRHARRSRRAWTPASPARL